MSKVYFFLQWMATFVICLPWKSTSFTVPTATFFSSKIINRGDFRFSHEQSTICNRQQLIQWERSIHMEEDVNGNDSSDTIGTKNASSETAKKKRTKSFDDRWNEKFNELVAYKEEHGDCMVPQAYETNPSLGRWVRYQRFDGFMTKERVEKLNSIGFIWGAKEAVWNSHIDQLKEYRNIFGHVNVPQNCDDEYRKLSMWVQNQRVQYRYLKNGNAKKSFLTPERIAILESLGFAWDMNEVYWMEKWHMLKKFTEDHGHANVPSRYEQNPRLARWVLNQRVQFRKHLRQQKNDHEDEPGQTKSGSRLTQKRIDLLNSLGFVWDPSDLYWWEQYRALNEYKNENGHCSIPSNHPNQKLVHWVHNQRRLCREYVITISAISTEESSNISTKDSLVSGLNEERLQALRQIDFCWLPPLPGESITRQQRTLSQNNLFDTERLKKQDKSSNSRNPRVSTRENLKKSVVPFPWDEI